MKCTVIRSRKRALTYICLRDGFSFEDLPVDLQTLFGSHETEMSLDMDQRSKLAREDIERVRHNLRVEGYHLQLPPDEDPFDRLALLKKTETSS